MKHKEFWLGILAALCLAGAIFCLAANDWQTAQGISEKITRLQIIANSDSQEDQALKLKVRDAVREKIREITEGIEEPSAAREALRENLAQIREKAREVIHDAGMSYPVEAVLEETEYPYRNYGSFALPAGNYLALRVKIGEAAGKNWWCVAFPDLCEPYASLTESCLTEEEAALMTDETPEVRFFLVECVQKLMNQEFEPTATEDSPASE